MNVRSLLISSSCTLSYLYIKMKSLLQIISFLSILPCFGQSTLTDTTSGCKYILPWSCDICTVKWTGNCIDSLPNRNGVLTVFYENELIMEYKGNMSNGNFNGVGKYKDGMSEMEGYFADGNFISSDTALFDDIDKVVVSTDDPHSLYINDGISNTNLFYYKMSPKEDPLGVLIVIPSAGETAENLIKQIKLHREAVKRGLLVIIPSINWGTNDRLAETSFLDEIFKEVVKEHNAPVDKFILCGLSNGGMISFEYAINSVRDKNTFIVPKGIIGLDPPLDYAHCYKYCEREIERNYNQTGVAEAKWMLGNYNTHYGGSPEQFPEKYVNASIFSYGTEDGGNAKYLTDIAIRMHSDLNLDFLINKRKRDLYDWNGTDIVAFVNQLKLNGNKNAEVIITHNKGVRYDGTKHPHSWSIMDTNDTIQWILKLIE